LAEVASSSTGWSDKVRMIVEEEGEATLGEEWRENFCCGENFILGKIFGAKLKNTCPAVCQFAGE
jgi:hypothetical protein